MKKFLHLFKDCQQSWKTLSGSAIVIQKHSEWLSRIVEMSVDEDWEVLLEMAMRRGDIKIFEAILLKTQGHLKIQDMTPWIQKNKTSILFG